MRTPAVIALLSSCALGACAHVDVQLKNFMTPDRGVGTARLAAGYVIENLVLAHDGQAIGMTYARHPNSRSVILFCGGDTFHRSIEGGAVLSALAIGADVVLFDYPGHGDTTGAPTVAAILDTAVVAYDAAFPPQLEENKKRILYGFSMGGLVAAQLAKERRADGIILEASPPSVRQWASSRIPLPFKPFLKPRIEPQLAEIDAVASLQLFRGSILLLTSGADRVVPARLVARMEQQLKSAARDVARVDFPDRVHGTIHEAPGFPATLRAFVDHVRSRP